MSKSSSSLPPALGIPSFTSPKLTPEHMERKAILYVRQSTGHQLREHQESTARQYGLTSRLMALGWPADRIVVIDDDLGISGTGKVDRPGFRRLLSLVTEQQAGIVLGLEMSRLARNSRDWQDLFEVCAIFRTLIADEDGLFDPNDPNDRLVLGLKGIISELELHTMKVRLERGRLNKAKRGEMFHTVPVGYVKDEHRLPQLDPDESAQHVMRMFFSLFESLGSANALYRHLAEQNIRLPFRDCGGPIDWRVACKTGVYAMLKHPLYAGAYGYGMQTNYRTKSSNTRGRKHLSPSEWKVLMKDLYPAYITWDQYEANQRRLQENDLRGDRARPPRGGSALLGGIVFCGHCGGRMSPVYAASGKGSYTCNRFRVKFGVTSCHNAITSPVLDAFVADQLLKALSPAAIDFSLQVIEQESARREQLETLHQHRVQQATYTVDLAQRRYKEVDPAHRLVAARLEQDWEQALSQLEKVTGELEQLRRTQPIRLNDSQRQELLTACRDVSALWTDYASLMDRKQIARLLLQRVDVQVHAQSERTGLVLHWSGGFETQHEITRTVVRYSQLTEFEPLRNRLVTLAREGHSMPEIARLLDQEGFRSPRQQKPLSQFMIQKLLDDPLCVQQLNDPELKPHEWRSADLASKLNITEKRLKAWVTRGWARAVQRPQGRTWVIFANPAELRRLQKLVALQQPGAQSPPEKLRTPLPIPAQKP